MPQQTDKHGWTIPVSSDVSDEDDDVWGSILVDFFDDELDEDVFERDDTTGALLEPIDFGGFNATGIDDLFADDIFVESDDSGNSSIRFRENGGNRAGFIYAPGSALVQLWNYTNTESVFDVDLATSDVNFANGTLSEQGNAVVTEDEDEFGATQTDVPLTELADGDMATGVRMRVPTGKTLSVYELGVQDDTGAVPTGLSVEVYDHGAAAAVASASTQYTEGSPLGSVSGSTDVSVRVVNSTGGRILTSGFAVYSVV